jgi:hypothetical protein
VLQVTTAVKDRKKDAENRQQASHRKNNGNPPTGVDRG